MTSCPKCNGRMSGPRFTPAFARGAHEMPHEALVYTCQTCGYQESGPTADQKRDADAGGCPPPLHRLLDLSRPTPTGTESLEKIK